MRAIRELLHPARCCKVDEIDCFLKVFEDECSIPSTRANVCDAKNAIGAITIEIFGDDGMLVITKLGSNEEMKQCEPENLQYHATQSDYPASSPIPPSPKLSLRSTVTITKDAILLIFEVML